MVSGNKEYFAGIDLGTSSVKLLLMDEDGRVIRTVSRCYPISFPADGWSEQNPADWYTQSVDGMKELLAGIDGSAVKGMGFGGQMHGLVALDENDCVIRPAILWNDGRTEEESRRLNSETGRDRLCRYTANIAFAGFTAPKLLWLKKHEPDNFRRIKKIMLPKDYLVWRYTGSFTTDVSDASGTLLFDVKNRRWSDEMCDICEIDRRVLPRVHESSDPVGTLTAALADELGLSRDVKVAAGAGDNAAAALATGTVGEGRCSISLGTSGTIFISRESFCVDSANALHSFCDASGGYHLMGCMLSAASCNKWWNEDVLMTRDYAAEQENISRLGENRVFFLPYLMGERSPLNDANARGAFVGMSMDTTRSDMTQAVLEGVAFALRDSFEVAKGLGMDIGSAALVGGGSRSPLWRKIISNVLGISLVIPVSEEGPSMGGAMLGAVASGCFRDIRELSLNFAGVKETLEPDRELTERYNERYGRFRELYPALKDFFAGR